MYDMMELLFALILRHVYIDAKSGTTGYLRQVSPIVGIVRLLASSALQVTLVICEGWLSCKFTKTVQNACRANFDLGQFVKTNCMQ